MPGGLPDLSDKNDPIMKCLYSRPRVKLCSNNWSDDEEEEPAQVAVKQELDWEKYQEEEHNKLGKRCPPRESESEDYDDSKSGVSTNLSDIETLSGVTTVVSSISALTNMTLDLEEEYDWRPSNRDPLEVDKHREQIIESVMCEKVMVISGHTGCGKTTQVPQFILDICLKEKRDVNIIVTQPRKIAAKSIAEHVCKERGLQLGGLVGYHVGLDKMNKSENTKLLYVTTGVLKEMLIGNKDAGNKFTHIILDEVHERELDTDFLLTFFKKQMMTTGTNYKLILMSATINRKRFQEYFATSCKDGTVVPAKHHNVGFDSDEMTTNKKVIVMHLDKFKNFKNFCAGFKFEEPKVYDNAIQAAFKVLENLPEMDIKYKMKKAGAVLIFLPGLREMELVEQRLREGFSDNKYKSHPKLKYIQLHSSLAWQDLQLAFQDVEPMERKVILATNIAESSITLKDIVYILDFCLTKRLEKDSTTEYPQLQLCWASKNQLQQRKGRAGRVDRGHVFQLIPEAIYRQLDEEQKPEVARVPLANVVLEIKMCDFGSPKEFLAIMMDCPKLTDIFGAVQKLKLIGALLTTAKGEEREDDGDLTVLGEVISKLPLDVQLGKLIVLGHIFGVLDDAIIIAAGLNGKSIFNTYYKEKLKSYGSKLHWSDGSQSDFGAILNAYKSWRSRTASGDNTMSQKANLANQFCKRYNLAQKQLTEMADLIQEIKVSLKRMKIETPVNQPGSKHNIDNSLVIDIIVFAAFYPNYFYAAHNEHREKDAFRTVMENDPMRSVYFQDLPREDVPFAELYTLQVTKYLENIVSVNAIEAVKFDGTKIIVVFKSDIKSSENSIPAAALKAVKNGNLKNELELDLYHPDKAMEFLANLRRGSNTYEGTLEVEQLAPPCMTTTEINMQIMHLENPQCMWVVYEENWDKLNRMHVLIQKTVKECPLAENIQVGGIYLVFYQDSFYRGRVECVEPLQVFFIDHGNSEQCRKEEIRSILVELQADLSDPAYAVEVSLVGVQPNAVRYSKNQWDTDVKKEMEDHYNSQVLVDKFFTGEIYADVESKTGFNMFKLKLTKLFFYTKETGERDEYIAWLLRHQLAQPAVESFSVQLRAKERIEFAQKHDAMQEHLNNPDRYREAGIVDRVSPGMEMTTRRVGLKGPYHAMTTSVCGITTVNKYRMARIDPASVNSVLLDWNPSAENHRWLTADSVSLSAQTGNLRLRNTGWLPCRPGMGAVVIRMFAPTVQRRVN
jgi:ATP-dependent RNA helicase TDRD9